MVAIKTYREYLEWRDRESNGIAIFSAVGCDYCTRAKRDLRSIAEKYQGKFSFVELPIKHSEIEGMLHAFGFEAVPVTILFTAKRSKVVEGWGETYKQELTEFLEKS